MSKLLKAIGAASVLLASGSASAVVVGGVDFGTLGALEHIETSTLAETFVNGVLDSNGDTQVLRGYGQVNTVNGSQTYAGSNLLYYVFEYDVAEFNPTSIGPTNGIANFINGQAVFYLGNVGNLLDQDSDTNVANIESLGEWATFSGHADFSGFDLLSGGQLNGSILDFSGGGLLDVESSSVAGVYDFLNVDDISDGIGGFADLSLRSGSDNFVLNPHDNTTGCSNGTAEIGQWCLAGSASFRGNTFTQVPEPSTIALLGLGLVGLGGTFRKQKTA